MPTFQTYVYEIEKDPSGRQPVLAKLDHRFAVTADTLGDAYAGARVQLARAHRPVRSIALRDDGAIVVHVSPPTTNIVPRVPRVVRTIAEAAL